MTFDARFVMEPSLFTQHPDTMLGRMFSGVDYVQVQLLAHKELLSYSQQNIETQKTNVNVFLEFIYSSITQIRLGWGGVQGQLEVSR